MLKNIFTYNLYQNHFCAVEHTQNKQIHYLLLKKEKDEFIKEKEDTVRSVKALDKQIPKEQHLFLIINNEQVLTKKVAGVLSVEKAFVKAFSNIKITDFYIELVHANNHTFIAICRKDIVVTLLEEYKQANFNIIQFSLGNLVATQILHLIDEDRFKTSNAIVQKEDNKLVAIEEFTDEIDTKTPNNYDINGLQIKHTAVLSLSGIISYYANHIFSETSFAEQTTKLQEHYKQKRVFSSILKFGLGFIFSLLLISFLVFSNYHDKVSKLSNENDISKNLKKTFFKLKAKTAKKKKLFNEVANTNSNASYYLDEIGGSIPKSILLTQLNYQPKQKSIKKEKEILVFSNQILVKGKSSDSKVFSLWVAELEKMDWIKSVAISNYGTGKKTTTRFELLIKIQ